VVGHASSDLRTVVADLGVNENEGVYYDGNYWNNLDAVQRMFNQRIAGGTPGKWFEDFFARRGTPFRRGLFLNCGNGWVEREMVAAGVVPEGVGIDYSEALLEEARRDARRYDLPLTYHQMNVNTAAFPSQEFDLVVNYAAAHHIAMIDRVFREICRLLPEDGWFLSFDYVGPHRNQYSSAAWERAWSLNNELPPPLRQTMSYPHAPSMVQIDPTEAIHSELILEMLHRYFHVERLVPLGGAIAYPILTHNEGLFSCGDLAEQSAWVEEVLRVDEEFLAEHPESTLFAYIAATPNKQVLAQTELLAEWEQEESDREDRARADGGLYYPSTALQDVNDRLVTETVVSAQLRGQVADLQSQLDAIRRDPVVARLTALRGSGLAGRLRNAPVLGPLYSRLRGD
jgi:SAM-dependent methyltransferase